MVYTPPDVKGQVCQCIITDPGVAANAAISLDAYDIKFDMDAPYPILSIDIIKFLTTGPSFSYGKYNTDNYGTSGALAGGEMAITDEDTFTLGDALNVANTQYVLIIKYIGSRIKNT